LQCSEGPHQVLKRDNEGTRIELEKCKDKVNCKLSKNISEFHQGDFRRDENRNNLQLLESLQGSGEISKIKCSVESNTHRSPCKMSSSKKLALRQVFIRAYRLEIANFLRTFRHVGIINPFL
jgi:hypothetical protein